MAFDFENFANEYDEAAAIAFAGCSCSCFADAAYYGDVVEADLAGC